jgi:hypothetical protein
MFIRLSTRAESRDPVANAERHNSEGSLDCTALRSRLTIYSAGTGYNHFM